MEGNLGIGNAFLGRRVVAGYDSVAILLGQVALRFRSIAGIQLLDLLGFDISGFWMVFDTLGDS